ncbi:hypothetical protein XPA_003170 [Xanthoria parietina]
MATAKQATAAKKTAAKETKEGTGIHAPVQPSPELGAIVGTDTLPRSQVISKVWEYIKKQQPAEPGEQARDPRRRQAEEGLRHATSAPCSR